MRNLFYQLSKLTLLLLAMVSCKQESSEIAENKYVLRLAKEKPEDVYIEVIEDSSLITMNKYLVRDSSLVRVNYFLKINGKYHERLFFNNIEGDERDTVDLLMWSARRDTTYQHIYPHYGKYSSIPFRSKDHLVKIFSEGDNHYITEKYSPYNKSELVERFTYNQDYTILTYTFLNARRDTLRFINTSLAEGGTKDLATKARK